MSTFTPVSSAPTFIQSREISATRTPGKSFGGFRHIEVICDSCNHQWTARPGAPADGGFSLSIGAVRVGCPACGVEGSMPVPEVLRVAVG